MIALLLAALFVAPVALLFAEVDPARLAEIAGGASFAKVLGVTAASAGLGALASTVLGFLGARVFALAEFPGKRALRLAGLLPYLVPNFVLASAYVVTWNPMTGLANGWLPLPFELYGILGMTLAFAVAHAPVAFLTLEAKLARIDPALRESARLAGASSLTVARRIELPLLLPSLLGAFALSFSLNASAFAIPAWIGAPAKAYPLTYKIYQAIQLGGVDGIPDAGAWAVYLLLAVAPFVLAMAFIERHEARRALATGKGGRLGEARLDGVRFAAFLAVYGGWLAFSFYLPLGVLGLSTLVPPGCLQSRGAACLAELSGRSYSYVLFELAETRLALHGSLVYGTLSAALVLLIALGALMAQTRSPRAGRVTSSVFTLLMATPGAIIALGLIVSCTGRFGINLYNSPWIVVAAMVLKHQNLAYQPLRTGLGNLGPALVEAARLSGAGTPTVWRRILVPLLRPEILGGFFLVLVPVLGELTMSVFLASPSFRSLGTLMFDLQDYADQASAGALAMILVALVLIANEAARLVSRGRVGY